MKQTQEHELMLEWDSSATNDMIADSCLALILGIDKSPASVKRELYIRNCGRFVLNYVTVTTHSHSHTHPHPHSDIYQDDYMVRVQRLAMFLDAHFGDIELYIPEESESKPDEEVEGQDIPGIVVRLDDADAFIDLSTMVSSYTLLFTKISSSNGPVCRM